MRVLVAGASGAIGTRLVPQLIDAGHEVIGTHKSAASAERLRALGAEPLQLDLLDPDAVTGAVLAQKPDAIVHQATALANLTDLKNFDRSFHQRTSCEPGAPTLCLPPRRMPACAGLSPRAMRA